MAQARTRTFSSGRTDDPASTGSTSPCRLCSAPTSFWNCKRLLDRHDVGYFLCSGCGSLQVEQPYWLDEAYDVSGIGADLGAGQRTIDLVLKTGALLTQLGLPRNADCIDYGGGIGLFTRLMRDRGFNFRSYDLYATPFFSDRYSLASLAEQSPAIMTAFEVVEHFPDPARDLEKLFEPRPALLIVTTETFEGQDIDWPYLAPETGQHVFFYSRRALDMVAARFGYALASVGGLFVFVEPAGIERLGIAPARAVAVLRALSQGNMLMRQALALFVEHQRDPYRYVLEDVAAGGGSAT